MPPGAPPPTTQPPQQELTRAEIIERALPSVVLVLSYRPDGSTMYGSGIVVRDRLVLTSQHVVAGARALGAMLYRPGRTSYTPMDGGLARYLFENQTDVVVAELVDGDATSDLAVIKIDADTSGLRAIPIARSAPQRGDRVLALGHPQETVWSFTEGVVGAMHQGAIQHDARVSQGSSGGPLLNTRGEVIGINVANVASEARGLAFARPIEMASRFLDAPAPQSPLDLSAPEQAALSCWRAQELGLADVADCFDWETGWTTFRGIAEEARGLVAGADVRARIEAYLREPGAKEKWISEGREHTAGFARVDAQKKMKHEGTSGSDKDLPREVIEARARMKAAEAQMLRDHQDQRGVRADAHDASKLQARLRMGIRVEEVRRLDGDRAWVLLAGRGPDGSSYRLSELWAKRDRRWLQRWPPLPGDTAALPAGWPPPLVTYAEFRVKKLEAFIRRMSNEPGAPTACDAPAQPSNTAQRSGGSPPRAVLKSQ